MIPLPFNKSLVIAEYIWFCFLAIFTQTLCGVPPFTYSLIFRGSDCTQFELKLSALNISENPTPARQKFPAFPHLRGIMQNNQGQTQCNLRESRVKMLTREPQLTPFAQRKAVHHSLSRDGSAMDEFTYITTCCQIKQQQSDFPDCQIPALVQNFLGFVGLLSLLVNKIQHF